MTIYFLLFQQLIEYEMELLVMIEIDVFRTCLVRNIYLPPLSLVAIYLIHPKISTM